MSDTQTAVAIVGMACRFPGANSLDAYWKLLCEGTDAITEVPPERWSLDEFHADDGSTPGKTNARWGGFLDRIDRFDASFFGVSPREVIGVSPQQRLLLEVAWEAVDNAGIAMRDLSATSPVKGRRTGVFVGVSSFDYYDRVTEDPARLDGYSLTGNAYSVTANRLSYLFDLRGPSIAVDTACSSSLVAIHLACQSLAAGECTAALAGGVQIMLSPWIPVAASKGEFLAPDGRCKTFDERANGYVRGEGLGIVVLKRLDDALADGDRIWGVIRGSAVNQDGRSNGLTAPNPGAQVEVVSTALARAGIAPARVGYVEAHGTGTRLGDPIELNALGTVLGERAQRCFVGSVKTNFGHLEAAAGVAGLIKSVLCVHHGELVPHLHFEQPNPLIDFARLPLTVATAHQPWPAQLERIAGVSSFGFGGTNAHLVVTAPPAPATPAAPAADDAAPALLCLSARSTGALARMAEQHAAWLRAHPAVPLAHVAATAALGRTPMSERLAVVLDGAAPAQALERAAAALRAGAPASPPARKRGKPRIAFLFTGQGAQYVGMGQALLARFPAYRETWAEADAVMEQLRGERLSDIVFGSGASATGLAQTRHTQPAQYVLQVALDRVLASCGIEPAMVLGHSVGEFAAAVSAGVLDFADGLRLVAERAAGMQACQADGAMLAARMPRADAQALLAEQGSRAVIAAVNGADSVVLSGPQADIAALESVLAARQHSATRLNVSHAFHSPAMEPAARAMLAAAGPVEHGVPAVCFISTVTAEPLDGAIAWPQYWAGQIVAPVEFDRAAARLAQEKPDVVIEIGPRPVLVRQARAHFPAGTRLACALDREQPLAALLAAIGACFEAGGTPCFERVFMPGWQRQHLPPYPFEPQVHALYPPVRSSRAASGAQRREHAFMRAARIEFQSDGASLVLQLSSTRYRYLGDHTVFGVDVLPATGFIELAQAAAFRLTGNRAWRLEKLEFRRPLVVRETDHELRIELTRADDGWRFAIADAGAPPGSDSTAYSCGLLRPQPHTEEAAA